MRNSLGIGIGIDEAAPAAGPDTRVDLGGAVERSYLSVGEELAFLDSRDCLACHLEEMISKFGCLGDLRFAREWNERQSSPYPGLLRWLAERGGGCDCLAALNVFGCDPEILNLREAPRGGLRRPPHG